MLNVDLVPKTNDGDLILLTDDNGGTYTCTTEDFNNRFAGCTTYEEYTVHPNSVGLWQTVFDNWKAEGYFN